MKMLEESILKDAKVLSEEKLDVGAFLNSRVDPQLMKHIGEDFAKAFDNLDFDAFVTVETSGIAPAIFASYEAKKPLIIIKKETSIKPEAYAQVEGFSFTKNASYYLTCKKEDIENKKVILIDDFLANGSVVEAVHKLLLLSNSELMGVGICIAKGFQKGLSIVETLNVPLYIQAKIQSMNPSTQEIHFERTSL